MTNESSAVYRLHRGDTPRLFLVRRNERHEVNIQIAYAWGERERPNWLRKGTLSIGYGENSSRILLVSLQPSLTSVFSFTDLTGLNAYDYFNASNGLFQKGAT